MKTLAIKLHLLVFISFIFSLSAIPNENQMKIKNQNIKVESLIKKIEQNEFPHIFIDNIDFSENGGGGFRFYWNENTGKILAAFIIISHETWQNKFCYFFDANGFPIKYLKQTINRPDQPPEKGIIYGDKGEIIWQNIEAPPRNPNEIIEMFKKFRKSIDEYQSGFY
ncbi:hypothetical protein ACFLRB_06355, partial [Acidobacteriota bacterium]